MSSWTASSAPATSEKVTLGWSLVILLRPALAEAHDPVTAALHRAHEQDEEQDDEQNGRQSPEQGEPEARVRGVDRVRYVRIIVSWAATSVIWV